MFKKKYVCFSLWPKNNLFTPRYSWNIVKVGVKHQWINQPKNMFHRWSIDSTDVLSHQNHVTIDTKNDPDRINAKAKNKRINIFFTFLTMH